MLLLVALIVAALVASDAPASIGERTGDLICRIAHGGKSCDPPKPPPACTIRPRARPPAERCELTLLATPELTARLPAQLAVARSRTSPGDFGASVEAMKAQNRLEWSDYRLVEERDADAPGARMARRVEATYVQPDGTPVRTIDLVVHSRRGVRYDVFARAPEADFARLRLAEAVDSFRSG